MISRLWGAHASRVLVSAFCGDELRLNVAARTEVSFEKGSRLANAFGVASTLQACAPHVTAAAQADLIR